MRRNLFFWLYFIVAILLAIYFGTRTVMTFTGHGPTSVVRNISIHADSHDIDLNNLAAVTGITPGTHTYSLKLETVNERIGKIPGIKESAVRRLANGNLVVHVRLYRAIAEWTDGMYFYPLSDDGTIVNTPSEERTPGTVLFRGNVPNNLTDITKSAHALISDLDYLEWIDERRWNLHTTGDITVMLPEQDPISAIGTLIVLNNQNNILKKNLDTIDMRDSARILVK